MAIRRHLFVCTNTRASGKPACGLRGSEALIVAVQRRLLAASSDIAVTACGCLGPCFDGPTAVVYPDGTWYGGVVPEDADALAEHLLGGPPVAAKLIDPPGQ
jgi:(2Fe-2S) ferredoxin